VILPPEAPTSWTGDQHRLHRLLRRHPQLLPAREPLLLAISGGQDSMALVGLLLALQPQHRWQLLLWHGDHRWRHESTAQAQGLQAWAAARGLPLLLDSWERPEAQRPSEAAARQWRYSCLEQRGRQLACRRVVTGHTASDRAETLLLNLARGCHRRGLASLGRSRALGPGIELVRPLLEFSRADTGRICRELELPLWLDPSNQDSRFSRNRVRQEVIPVLESLHPGATQRMARLAEQLAEVEQAQGELLELALAALETQAPPGSLDPALNRKGLGALTRANQGQLIQTWLERLSDQRCSDRTLSTVLDGLSEPASAGGADLGSGWRLHWRSSTLWLSCEV
jgi:tRNA(Ile)-lysidine synthase